MRIFNQPYDGALGDLIKRMLEQGFNELYIFSAFAKSSGVERMKKELHEFKNQGGKIFAFIGIDLLGTSYEALNSLLDICTSLTVVHSENTTTYHSKIYMLTNENEFWLSVGSNNLTNGGLWTNIESSVIIDGKIEPEDKLVQPVMDLVNLYLNEETYFSIEITDKEVLDILKDRNYIKTEGEINLNLKRNLSNNYTSHIEYEKLFGTLNLSSHLDSESPISTLDNNDKSGRQASSTSNQKNEFYDELFSLENEVFWFEMRKSTGASRNILDLSKTGKIHSGNVADTKYDISDSDECLGGVSFFDIDPSSITTQKDITVNFDGQDFGPSTIKFPQGENSNQSWRILLKGENSSGERLSNYLGTDKFIDKILFFEKITTDYYILSLVSDDELNTLVEISEFTATNGRSPSGKKFGLLSKTGLEV